MLLPELHRKMRAMTPGLTEETLAGSGPVAEAYFRVTLEVVTVYLPPSPLFHEYSGEFSGC